MNRIDAAYLQKCTLKMAKWANKAEDALTRKQALKALRKYGKWSTRLAEYEAALRKCRRDIGS